MTRPSVAELEPWRSERARSLRRKPSWAIAVVTRSAVCGATLASSLMTRETVLRLTPARSATWRIVGRAPPRGDTAAALLSELTTLTTTLSKRDDSPAAELLSRGAVAVAAAATAPDIV